MGRGQSCHGDKKRKKRETVLVAKKQSRSLTHKQTRKTEEAREPERRRETERDREGCKEAIRPKRIHNHHANFPSPRQSMQADVSTVPLSITLVWTDCPGNPASNKLLVNDLNLGVTVTASTNTQQPVSTVYYPNDLQAADNTNNVEKTIISVRRRGWGGAREPLSLFLTGR